jgi:hypothetical protein
MATLSSTPEDLEEALVDLGFSATREFGVFVTFERQRDSVKIHASPDGMFAAFDGDDEILGEGTGAEDLRRVLMEALHNVGHATRQSFHNRRKRMKGSSSRPSVRARSRGDQGGEAPATLSASAFSRNNC